MTIYIYNLYNILQTNVRLGFDDSVFVHYLYIMLPRFLFPNLFFMFFFSRGGLSSATAACRFV